MFPPEEIAQWEQSKRGIRIRTVRERGKPRPRNPLSELHDDTPLCGGFGKYGLTFEQYEAMFTRQGGKCLVCRNDFTATGKRKPCIDHCHKTGVVRGILCGSCNSAEGFLGTIETAQRMLDFMKSKRPFNLALDKMKKSRRFAAAVQPF
jgi:hypothetical protein